MLARKSIDEVRAALMAIPRPRTVAEQEDFRRAYTMTLRRYGWTLDEYLAQKDMGSGVRKITCK